MLLFLSHTIDRCGVFVTNGTARILGVGCTYVGRASVIFAGYRMEAESWIANSLSKQDAICSVQEESTTSPVAVDLKHIWPRNTPPRTQPIHYCCTQVSLRNTFLLCLFSMFTFTALSSHCTSLPELIKQRPFVILHLDGSTGARWL